jgi:uncharacterized delta-60 repeat protein
VSLSSGGNRSFSADIIRRIGRLLVVATMLAWLPQSLPAADGQVDTTFQPPLFSYSGGTDPPWGWDVALDEDGLIYVARREGVYRLFSDGRTDSRFFVSSGGGENAHVIKSVSGGIIVAYNNHLTPACPILAKFDFTGNELWMSSVLFDRCHDVDVHELAIQRDGKILVGGRMPGGLMRFFPDGRVDTSFAGALPSRADGISYGLAIHPLADGRILAAYNLFTGNEQDLGLVRLLPNGAIDPSYDWASAGIGLAGRIVAAANGQFYVGLTRLNADLSVDPSFQPEVSFPYIRDVHVVQSDGKVIVDTLDETGSPSGVPVLLGRLHPDGSIDHSFAPLQSGDANTDGYLVNTIVTQRDGKILAAGALVVPGMHLAGFVRIDGPPPPAPPRIEFTSLRYTGSEGGKVTIAARRAGDLSQSASVKFGSLPLTAFPWLDFRPAFGELRFAAGEDQSSIDLALRADRVREQTEYAVLLLFSPQNAGLGGRRLALLTIRDRR